MNEEKILAAIAALGSEMVSMENRLTGRLDGIDVRLDRIEEDIVEIKEDIVEIKEDMEELKEDATVTRETVNQILEWSEWVSPSLSSMVREDVHSD